MFLLDSGIRARMKGLLPQPRFCGIISICSVKKKYFRNHSMFEQAFKNIDDVLWKEAGCTTELDYTEQTSWLLFLKYLDDLEQDKSTEAALEGKKYTHILDKPYRWESWAAPKDKDGKLDHNKASTGDDLRDFVNANLFPYLHGFKQKASGPNTIEYKIGRASCRERV